MEMHCCADMRREIERMCDQHPDRFHCPDCLVNYSSRFREYGLIIHDGGSSIILIRFCPWCGSALPASLRNRWFKELEAMCIAPGEQPVPERYQTSEWWAGLQTESGIALDSGGNR